MRGALLSKSDMDEIEGFVQRMRAIGAVSVSIGDVSVAFEAQDAPVDVPAAPYAPDPDEAKKQIEKLLYASSD